MQGKSVFMICFQFCDASFKSTGYSITRKVAEAVSRTFRSADPSFLPLFFLTPFAPSAPLKISGALNFLYEGAWPGKATEKAVRPKRGASSCCPLWGWCSAQRIKIVMIAGGNHTSVSCRDSGKGGAGGDFELLPFNEQHPLCDSLRAAWRRLLACMAPAGAQVSPCGLPAPPPGSQVKRRRLEWKSGMRIF